MTENLLILDIIVDSSKIMVEKSKFTQFDIGPKYIIIIMIIIIII